MPAAPAPNPAPPKLWLLRAAKALVVFVYIVVLIDVVLLILGFFLQLFGASTDAEFTRWVYRNLERVMEPFRGMFPSRAVSDQSVLDVSLLFAMVVYSIVGVAIHALVTWLTDRIVAQQRLQHAARAGMPLSGAATQRGGPAPHDPPGVPTGPGPSCP